VIISTVQYLIVNPQAGTYASRFISLPAADIFSEPLCALRYLKYSIVDAGKRSMTGCCKILILLLL
jgi:hypothetical protein